MYVFTWDPHKEAANRRKHGVSFAQASTVFSDPLAATGADPDHSIGESRWITFGMSREGGLLVVSHSDEGNMIRIISARVATLSERRLYEEG
jgi:uncharacterized protein